MKQILKLVLLILNIALLALLLGSTLAGRVAPSRFIWFSYLSYGYLYFLIANVLLAIVWMLLKSKWFILPIVGILVRYSFLPLYFQVGGNEKPQEEDGLVKVMTFNAHHFYSVETNGEMTDSNMMKFLDIVDEENPDLLAMQEYIGKGGTVSLTDQLAARGYIHMASGYDNGSMSGEVIFSKLPILRVVRIEGPSKLYVNLAWGSDTLRLYCLHLNSYGLDESDQKQIHDISHGNVDSLMERSTVRKFRSTIVNHEKEWNVLQPYFDAYNRYTIVAGDFNETPASYFYQKCKDYFVDSYCEEGQGFSTTYHGLLTSSKATTFPAFRIDMVLHTPDMEAVSYKRIKSDISDHHPVVAAVRKHQAEEQ